MAKPKAPIVEVVSIVSQSVIPTSIAHIPVDYGREDINNMAKKINEIIDHLS